MDSVCRGPPAGKTGPRLDPPHVSTKNNLSSVLAHQTEKEHQAGKMIFEGIARNNKTRALENISYLYNMLPAQGTRAGGERKRPSLKDAILTGLKVPIPKRHG
jgi:hypothetical protein